MELSTPHRGRPDVADMLSLNVPHLVARVRAGAAAENGVLAERPDSGAANERVA